MRKGQKHSEASKEKMRKARTGRRHDEDTKERISLKQTMNWRKRKHNQQVRNIVGQALEEFDKRQ